MIKQLQRNHPTLLAALVYVALAAIFYLPLLLGLRTFPDGDFTQHFLPFSLFQQREWLDEQFLPLWNPFTYSGHPFLADVQAAVFYPLGDLLLLLTLPFSSPGARLYFLQLEAVIHIALAGFFTFLFVRDLTGQHGAGLLSGVLFAFSGYLTGYPPLQLAILRTAIWLPLILWLLTCAFRQPRRQKWWIAAASVYATALLAGHPQTFLHISYLMAAWIGFLFFWPRRSRKENVIAQVVGVLVFGLLSLALTALQWLPSLEFTRYSVRASVDYTFVSGGFPLRDTWQLIFPHLLTQFSPLYIGIVGLPLVAATVGRRWTELSRHSPATKHPSFLPSLVFFAILALIALLLSYGGNAFLYPLLYRFAPGWDLFRGQERVAYLVVFALSVLVGFGSAVLPEMALRARRVIGFVGPGGILVAAGVAYWTLQENGQTAVDRVAFVQIVSISLLFAVAVTAIFWLPGWDRWRTVVLVGLAFANLLWANAGTNLSLFGPTRKTILSPEMTALQGAVTEHSDANLGLPGRVYNEYRVYEDYGIRLGIEDVWGSSPLRSARYAALFEDFPLDRLWQLTGVAHVLTWRHDLFGPSELLADFPQATDTTFLHRLPEPNQRAWLTYRVRVADDDTALTLLADSAFDLASTALIPPEEADFPSGTEVSLTAPGGAAVELGRPASNRLTVDVNSAHGGLLIVSETWLPGWRIENITCAVDECTIVDSPLRADLTLLGVIVPPGQVTFELVYWPDSVRLGLAISMLTLMVLAALLYWHWSRARG